MISYIILGVGGIYTARWVRRLYRRQLKGLRRIYKYTILSFLVILSVHFIMIFELIFNLMVSNKSESLFSNYQYECLLPALKHTLPELGYFLVIAVFYTIAVIVVNQIVYQSVENYIENYKSHPDKITCMCINILVQGLLLLIGYFSLLISLVKLTA